MTPQQAFRLPHFAQCHQQGQALIYGIFVLMGGLAALLFVFNTGQLTAEKTKLVNTADAVAYSAAVMQARALNFDAYTNRALMANEVMIAQAVSIAAWSAHVVRHTENITPLNCRSYYSVPAALVLIDYIPVCYLLSLPTARHTAQAVDQVAQANMAATILPARKALMQQVADANYAGDGSVRVDSMPITDTFTQFEGGSFIRAYAGAERGRFKQAARAAAHRDAFVQQRSWTSANHLPCLLGNKAEFRRRGGTELVDFDAWKAMDTASLHHWSWHTHGLFHLPTCDDDEMPLGYGAQAAASGTPDDSGAAYGQSRADNPHASGLASSSDWHYSGLPTFSDIAVPALAYASTDPQPRLTFAIRLTRAKEQLRTSDGSSGIKPGGHLAIIDGKPAHDVLVAVATAQVYFERPGGRDDGKTELASLFNPYWQVRLLSTSAADLAAATALGGAR